MLRISNSVSWMLRIPVLSVSCQEAVTPVIKPCALIPDSVHTCCTLISRMLCHPSHGTDCPKNVGRSCDSHWDLIACIIGYLNSDLTGLTRSDLCLSIWISMKRFSQDSSCDVNVNCAMNVLKFQLGRFQKIITRTSRSIWATSPRKVQSTIGIVKSHCLSNWRRFGKGMDRLTRDRSVFRCSRVTVGIWLELIGAHNLSN